MASISRSRSGLALELELAEHVEHLPAEGLAGLLQLLQQRR
jgi:hypothetical protein